MKITRIDEHPAVAALLERERQLAADRAAVVSELNVPSSQSTSLVDAADAYLRGESTAPETTEQRRVRLLERLRVLDTAAERIRIQLVAARNRARREIVGNLELKRIASESRGAIFEIGSALHAKLKAAQELTWEIALADIETDGIWPGSRPAVQRTIAGLLLELAAAGSAMTRDDLIKLEIEVGRRTEPPIIAPAEEWRHRSVPHVDSDIVLE